MQAMNEVEQIEVTIEAVKEKIKMRKALKRLTKNKDFQLIVDTGYRFYWQSPTVFLKYHATRPTG
jgi:hypothetical protein